MHFSGHFLCTNRTISVDSLQEPGHRNAIQHKFPWKKNDGTTKHKVQLITLVHILVYDAVKMKDGIEENNAWTSFAQTEYLFVLLRTFWLMLKGIWSFSESHKNISPQQFSTNWSPCHHSDHWGIKVFIDLVLKLFYGVFVLFSPDGHIKRLTNAAPWNHSVAFLMVRSL